jgi:hypothetical protein
MSNNSSGTRGGIKSNGSRCDSGVGSQVTVRNEEATVDQLK